MEGHADELEKEIQERRARYHAAVRRLSDEPDMPVRNRQWLRWLETHEVSVNKNQVPIYPIIYPTNQSKGRGRNVYQIQGSDGETQEPQ